MTNALSNDIERILVSEEEIRAIVERIAEKIGEDYRERVEAGNKLLLLCILKGSIVFMGDLMKRIPLPIEIDAMRVKSYNGTKTTGNVAILLDLMRNDIEQLDILVIEDIIDSGKTLSYLVEYLKRKGAKSVRTCTLLDKPERRTVTFQPDYVGKVIPDEFVVGYGLDYEEKYRALPFVGVLKRAVYEK